MRIYPELAASADVGPVKNGFWKRQFLQKTTRPQLVFDLIFGVVGPILCFVFDPIVFQGGFAGPPFLPDYQGVVYLFSGVEIILLCLWLAAGKGNEVSNALIGGALLNGGLFCLTIAILLFPLSLIGLAFGIGLFGFTPFFTGIVYLRNGWRALYSDAEKSSGLMWATGAVCGFLLVAAIPIVLSVQIRSMASKSVDEIIRADPVRAQYAAQQLAVLRFFASANLDRIVWAYASETDENRKQSLKSCYREITGKDIDQRLLILND
ncbi:MAG TPA: hypothetical protein VJV21_03185 [Pyrinomonadaceae bacterium]|nr:hypothetical protein [Pyrinomonadaceae bacterium]